MGHNIFDRKQLDIFSDIPCFWFSSIKVGMAEILITFRISASFQGPLSEPMQPPSQLQAPPRSSGNSLVKKFPKRIKYLSRSINSMEGEKKGQCVMKITLHRLSRVTCFDIYSREPEKEEFVIIAFHLVNSRGPKIEILLLTLILAAVFGSRNDLTVFHNILNPEPALMINMRFKDYNKIHESVHNYPSQIMGRTQGPTS